MNCIAVAPGNASPEGLTRTRTAIMPVSCMLLTARPMTREATATATGDLMLSAAHGAVVAATTAIITESPTSAGP